MGWNFNYLPCIFKLRGKKCTFLPSYVKNVWFNVNYLPLYVIYRDLIVTYRSFIITIRGLNITFRGLYINYLLFNVNYLLHIC